MAVTIDLGRVGFNLKGGYSASTAYERLDVVHYENKTYAAKKNTTGNTPADGEYWQ